MRQVASSLEEAGLIQSGAAFRLLSHVVGANHRLKAGYFTLNTGMSAQDILGALVGERRNQVTITIPEGWDIKQISALLEKKGLAHPSEFAGAAKEARSAAANFPFLATLPGGASLEGFLFPDTYAIGGAQLPVQSLMDMMLARFEAVAWPLISQDGASLSPFQVVTLASIVEREAVQPKERPFIAGIYLHRLQLGMRLGADPTVEYALGRRQDAMNNLTLADISINSPYNTYRYAGLPPGPIANPGMAAIRAVLAPAATPYLYFVAKGDGSHQFSRTYGEHLEAQRRYRGRP